MGARHIGISKQDPMGACHILAAMVLTCVWWCLLMFWFHALVPISNCSRPPSGQAHLCALLLRDPTIPYEQAGCHNLMERAGCCPTPAYVNIYM